ncbi:hypothetical protein EC991_009141 [Linnemannia zychae]|nr:hypothetical protein EC991_009141 [Linnemannia zychae]
MPPELKGPKNGSIIEPARPYRPSPSIDLQEQPVDLSNYYYKRPSFFNRIYLSGVIHRPNDLLFLGHGLVSIIWTLACLLFVDLPTQVATRFRYNSARHPATWGPFYSFCMSMSRACSSSVHNAAQLRLVSNIIAWFIPLRMLHLSSSSYSVKNDVQIKIHLDTLLEPERNTLAPIRARLNLGNNSNKDPRQGNIRRNPVNPSPEYLASFLPDPTSKRLANLPEESGDLAQDGTYTLRGEWIEALEDPKERRGKNGTATATKPKSNVVILYCHGGGHVFCSATFHRQVVTRMLLEIGPGARAFVVDYRLAPEDPFPAAVHDIYAAYLYLTQPENHAITLCTNGSNNPHHPTPVLPKDIVLAGDSAGAGVAIAFQLYMRDYVQPSVEPKFEMPPVVVLISFNFARTYLCGDYRLVPNERNTTGRHMEWEWYRHLAQHPLVSPVYTADVSGLGSATLLQTGTFDRLADDTRLYAHKLGQASTNTYQRVRLELYQDMVHVHQFFEFLPMADKALCAIAEFIRDSQERYNSAQLQVSSSSLLASKPKRWTNNKDKPTVAGPGAGKIVGTEWIVVGTDGKEREGHDSGACPISVLEDCWNPKTRERAAAKA